MSAIPRYLPTPNHFKPLYARATGDYLYRYLVYYGGRGGGKSWEVAKALVLLASIQPLRILCAREIQNSINESVHKLLSDTIYRLKLSHLFTITLTSIKSKAGAEFIFKGIAHDPLKIKSLEGVDICWVEEAQKVSNASWEILIPTIRKEQSQIIVTFNPHYPDDATYQRFIVNTPPDTFLKKVNYNDNPHFPETLDKERKYLKKVDYEAYRHIWEGELALSSDRQVFKGKWEVADIPPTVYDSTDVYYGSDFGFSVDPTTLIRAFIVGNVLYITDEAYKVGCDLDDTPALYRQVPGADNHLIRADSARPETISYLRKKGFNITAADKWAGSIEDGISFLRSFDRIIIAPKCYHTADEFRLYSYKTNSIGDILPKVEDKHNHTIDAIRYALSPLIRTGASHLSSTTVKGI